MPPYLWNVFGVDAVDGVAHVLSGSDKQGEGEAGHDSDGVVQPEDARVNLDMGELDQALEPPQQVQHLRLFSFLSSPAAICNVATVSKINCEVY